MPSGDACLLYSNILLRISKNDDPQHAAISHALHTLVGQGARLCYTSQTLAEFWNASTLPLDKNGFGLSVAEAMPPITSRAAERRGNTPSNLEEPNLLHGYLRPGELFLFRLAGMEMKNNRP
jgi:hypothetical protein